MVPGANRIYQTKQTKTATCSPLVSGYPLGSQSRSQTPCSRAAEALRRRLKRDISGFSVTSPLPRKSVGDWGRDWLRDKMVRTLIPCALPTILVFNLNVQYLQYYLHMQTLNSNHTKVVCTSLHILVLANRRDFTFGLHAVKKKVIPVLG